MKKSERLFFIFFLIVGFVIFFSSMELSFITATGNIGSGFFIITLSIILIVLIGYWLLKSFLKKERKGKSVDEIKHEIPFNVDILKKQGLLIILFLGSLALLETLGFFFTLCLFLIVSFIWIERMQWGKSFGLSIFTIITLYMIFEVWLNARLPQGFIL